MTFPVLPSNVPSGGYQISRSVRLRSSASAYFNRTLSTPTSNTTWTLSCWLKRGALSNGGIFAESTGYAGIYFASDKIRVMDNAGSVALETTAVYRDPSAWAHLVVRSNGTNIKAYWNSVEVGSYTGTITLLNAATSHFIGRYSSNYFDGYLTEINFIDGQALTPSSFGATNTTTGVWGPAKYTGTYGTNGFYLNFSDNSAATAAAIGKDSSGNGNNWTPNNISVTAGVTYDSMVDTPTPYGTDTGVGGEVRGNYAVMSPIVPTGSAVISGGNLNIVGAGTYCNGLSTINLDSGAYYCECVVTTHSTEAWGVWDITKTAAANTGTTPSGFYGIYSGGATLMSNGTNVTTNAAGTPANGDIIQIAWSNGKVWLGKNNTWYDSSFGTTGNPSAGTNATFTGLTAGQFAFIFGSGNATPSLSANFGQRAFSYTAPSGYKALCTQNLSTPTIANGASYMAATTYDGNGSSQSLTNTVNSVSFQPDFVWVKKRSGATNHYLWDSVRGALKEIYSNLNSAEATNTIGLSAFNSNGFTLNNGDSAWNASGSTYVGWNWKAGGTAVTNNDGNRTASVSANTTAGFSVVTYTFSTSATNTIGHGLGVAPSMIIMKNRTQAYNWEVYHVSLGYTQRLILNSTGAATASYWAATPTSTVFSVTTSDALNNDNLVAYCFAAIAGYSAFGSYTGNGSTDGPFVYCGFRPRYLMVKCSSSTGSWEIYDTSRSPYNATGPRDLQADTASAENASTITTGYDILSNGFKCRDTTSYENTNGATYIYVAFAENPTKYALAR